MLVTCWSAKGGSGTTVVAAALASTLSARHGRCLLVDLAGDLPAALGLPDPGDAHPGVAGWLTAWPSVPADGTGRCEMPVHDGLALLPRGEGPLPDTGAHALLAALAGDPRPVVIDAGLMTGDSNAVALRLAAGSDQSLLVVRPCYLALRRALTAPLRATGVVVVSEEGRALGPADVEACLALPIRAEVRVAPEIARAVDSGLLSRRLPRGLARALSGVV